MSDYGNRVYGHVVILVSMRQIKNQKSRNPKRNFILSTLGNRKRSDSCKYMWLLMHPAMHRQAEDASPRCIWRCIAMLGMHHRDASLGPRNRCNNYCERLSLWMNHILRYRLDSILVSLVLLRYRYWENIKAEDSNRIPLHVAESYACSPRGIQDFKKCYSCTCFIKLLKTYVDVCPLRSTSTLPSL